MLIAVKRYILTGCHGMRLFICQRLWGEEESAPLPSPDFHGLFPPNQFFFFLFNFDIDDKTNGFHHRSR